MYCPTCNTTRRIKINLVTTFKRTKRGSENELVASCLNCKKDFSQRYTIKIINGEPMIA